MKKTITPDPDAVPFVAKVQKSKTRKGKDYFVFRTTIPKEIANKIDIKGGDYIFFRAKKAQWYHMLDWDKMENTWKMLPAPIRDKVIYDGFCDPKLLHDGESATTTNLTTQQMIKQLPMIQAELGDGYDNGNSF